MTDCGCRSHNGFLTSKGLEEAALRERESLELAGAVARRYLDRVGSVSALIEIENDYDYDVNHVELNRSTFLQLEMFRG